MNEILPSQLVEVILGRPAPACEASDLPLWPLWPKTMLAGLQNPLEPVVCAGYLLL